MRSFLKLTLFSFALFFCVSCSQPSREKKFKIGFSQCCEDYWRETMNLDIKREVAFLPELDLIEKIAGNSSEQQIKDIRSLIKDKVDILIVSPNEAEPLTAVIDSIYKLGIPVILLDRKVNSTNYTTHIGANNIQIGKEAAKYIINKISEPIIAIEVQLGMTITPAINRSKGFRKELLYHPENKIVGEVEDIPNIENLKIEFQKLYKENQNVNAIFGHNDVLTAYASDWIYEINPSHNVLLVGVDGLIGESGGVEMILNDVIDASLLYPTGGEQAVQSAIDILNGKRIDKSITLESTLIDIENARMSKLQGRKLLNQQADIERQTEMLADHSKALKNHKLFSTILSLLSVLLFLLVGFVFYQLRRNKRVALQLEEKNDKIYKQHRELEALSLEKDNANKEKVEFFTNISHEFKTPLTLILAPTEDLIENENTLSDAGKKQLELIKKNAERMKRLVRQLMDFRKIDTGKIKLKIEEVNLVYFIREIMSVFVNIKQSKNIDFKFISQLKSSIVLADVEMLDKVFFNLISNAFKFTPDDGFIHVQLAESKEDDQVVIKISDNGRGMSKEHVEHVFERFYQGENYSAKGTGLGLSLSKKLIDLHEGKITVVSEKGIGSTFTIRLPKHLAVKDEMKAKSQGEKELESSSFVKLLESDILVPSEQILDDSKLFEKAILIIEDNKDLVTFLTTKLGTKYRVLSALNGESGIKLAEFNIPDLIICDLMLPGIQGDEVVTFLKENIMTSHIPIIMLTAKDSDAQKKASFSQGIYDFISKPFNQDVLISKIDAVFQNMQSFKKYFGRELIYDIAKKKMNKNERQLLHKFDAYIQKNYNEANLNVEAVCKEMAMSKVQLYRKVKALTGSTINEYIQSVRIETAKDLLSDTDLSLSEIAHKCGFSSSSYFSRNFKNVVGLSPSEWKKKLPITNF